MLKGMEKIIGSEGKIVKELEMIGKEEKKQLIVMEMMRKDGLIYIGIEIEIDLKEGKLIVIDGLKRKLEKDGEREDKNGG